MFPDFRQINERAAGLLKFDELLQDMFGQKKIYGDMEEFLKELQKEGLVKEIHYIPNLEKQASVPSYIHTPWMIKDAGLIYGIR